MPFQSSGRAAPCRSFTSISARASLPLALIRQSDENLGGPACSASPSANMAAAAPFFSPGDNTLLFAVFFANFYILLDDGFHVAP